MFVKGRSRSKFQRLFVADPKHSKHAQTLVEQVVNTCLEVFIEVNHHVAAQNHLKLIERPVGRQVMLRKDHILFQR